MSKLKCIIFDMDGTLTQTNQLIYDSFNHVAVQYRNRRYTIPEITAMFGPPEEDALLAIVRKDQMEGAMKEYLKFYRENHGRLAQLFPGVKEVLVEIRQAGLKLALFTGKGTHTTGITMEEFGLTGLFDMVVTGNDVVGHKPSPEGIMKILTAFDLKPSEALMVGDAVSDIKASRAAGVKIAAVLWDSYGKEQVMRMNVDRVFHRMDEFRRWLTKELQKKDDRR